MTRTLLLDGDIFAYKTAAAMERPTNWGDGIWSLHSDQHQAERHLTAKIDTVMDDLKADACVVALSVPSRENFRLDILPTYKGNRAAVREPMLRQHLKDYLRATYETYDRPRLEADDILGILSTGQKIKGEKIIVSIDKDLKSIPGLLYNDSKPEQGVQEVTEQQADFWHMMQTLTGDVTDGYAGCPGIGKVKAEAIIDKALDGLAWDTALVWPAVVAAFVKAKLGEEEALRQARVARILRASDYDYTNKRPILWTPK